MLPVEYPDGGAVGSEGWEPNSPSGACHFLTRCGICETLPSARNRVPRLPHGRVTTPWIRTALSTARWEASEADGTAMQAVRDNRPLAVLGSLWPTEVCHRGGPRRGPGPAPPSASRSLPAVSFGVGSSKP